MKRVTLDETYATEHHDGGLFIWLTSVAANFR